MLVGGVAHADYALGRDKLVAGDYKTAIAELARSRGKDRSAARILLARAQSRPVITQRPRARSRRSRRARTRTAIEARILIDELRQATGRGADARKDLEQLYKDHPDDRAVRTALAEIRYAQGDCRRRQGALRPDDRRVRQAEAEPRRSDAALPAREAARFTSQYELANDSFRAAQKLRPQMTQIGVDWADLFSRKYASELAEQTLEEVFKVNPNQPDAHAAMAEVIAETRYDLAAVRHHLDAALAVNPKHARALRVRAVDRDRSQRVGRRAEDARRRCSRSTRTTSRRSR